MTDSPHYGTKQATAPIAFPVDAGSIARLLSAPGTNEFLRVWLGAAAGRDPVLAYNEAATLAGMLELLGCEEAQAWLLPALKAALRQDTETSLLAAVDIVQALRPAAAMLQEMGMNLPEPANG
jgi:hypothetical protein